MAYTDRNFKSKKELREALAAGEQITVYQPGLTLDTGGPIDGTVFLEGPHYPAPHTWYAEGTLQDGKLVKIK